MLWSSLWRDCAFQVTSSDKDPHTIINKEHGDPFESFHHMGSDKLQLALGCFSEEKYHHFSSSMDELMGKRLIAGYQKGNLDEGYTSDLERERDCLERNTKIKEDEPNEVFASLRISNV